MIDLEHSRFVRLNQCAGIGAFWLGVTGGGEFSSRSFLVGGGKLNVIKLTEQGFHDFLLLLHLEGVDVCAGEQIPYLHYPA